MEMGVSLGWGSRRSSMEGRTYLEKSVVWLGTGSQDRFYEGSQLRAKGFGNRVFYSGRGVRQDFMKGGIA